MLVFDRTPRERTEIFAKDTAAYTQQGATQLHSMFGIPEPADPASIPVVVDPNRSEAHVATAATFAALKPVCSSRGARRSPRSSRWPCRAALLPQSTG